jgi:hypothetical protein
MTSKPTTYDDITRRTVPDPDGSFRPSREQVAAAFSDPADRPAMMMDAQEQALYTRVLSALLEDPTLVHSRVRVDVEGTTVVLSGAVAGPPMVQRTEQIVRAVAGVKDVANHLSPVLPQSQSAT